MSQTESPPAFLRLPGELRNRIHRLVLLLGDGDSILIDSTGVPEPQILLTCKQVRREGVTIYYEENKFEVFAPDFDSSLLLRWTARLRALRQDIRPEVVASTPYGTIHPSWPNLSLWLRQFHGAQLNSRVYLPGQTPAAFPDWMRVIGAMFHLALKLQDQPWALVDEILSEHHNVLIAMDDRWR